MKRKSFILYTDMVNVVRLLTPEQRGNLFLAIFDFADGKEPTFDDAILKIAFESIKLPLLRDNEKYENNKAIIERLKIVKKHIDRCDPDYLADLIEEQENDEKVNNKSKIKDCNKFYDMIYNDTIALLHDMKNVILKSKTKI